ncbi:MAG: flotillin domain-containing protein [Paracoccaceae bacterium]|nr:flotillin domain-containing protein [Paracoccaceae bacterium]
MTGADFIAGIILIALAIAVAVYLLHWLYRRSSKEVSFVRTGFGGEKVVLSGGAFVLPIIHDVTMVGMRTLRIEVRRGGEKSLITKNRMRVELVVEFYVRVRPTREAVATAAQSLGRRTMEPDSLRELVEGRFIDALGIVAAKMSMDEIQEQRGTYAKEVRSLVEEALTQTGLELEAVSLTGLDQASLEMFNPSNAFDAEGLTQLTEQIEARKKLRNDIEQETKIQIRNKNLETEKQALDIEKESEFAKLQQEREIAKQNSVERKEIAVEKALQERETEMARLRAAEDIEKTRISQEEAIEVERSLREHSLTEEIENRRRLRNAIEQDTEVEIRRKNLEAEMAALEIARENEFARLEKEKNVATQKARQKAEVALEEAKRRREAEEAQINAEEEIQKTQISQRQAIEAHRIESERETQSLDIAKRKTLELQEQDRSVQIAAKASEVLLASAQEDMARAQAMQAKENVETVRELEVAERHKRVELIEAAQGAEREALQLTTIARAQKEASAEHEEAERHASVAAKLRYEIDAAGQKMLNEAENMRSDSNRESELRMELARRLDSIIRESVKPMNNIDAIKILDVKGMPGFSGAEASSGNQGPGSKSGVLPGSGAGVTGNLADDVVNSALRYRAQMPFVDNLLSEIGMSPGEISNISNILGNFDKTQAGSKGPPSEK